MAKKVDFRGKSKNKKRIKIIAITAVSLLAIYITIMGIIRAYKSLPQTIKETNKLYYKVDEYGSLEEILNRYNCAYIRTNESSKPMKVYVSFDRGLYTGETSNENFFFAMVRVIAEFEKFKDFELIDEGKDITLSVKCEETNIVEYKINGDVNYYLNHDSEINARKAKASVTRFTIQSKELQDLINNNWDDSKVNFGTKESTCNEYNIYFDEGIQYKKVNRKVFNLIFTEKYSGAIAGGLNASSTKKEITTSLGEPTFFNGETVYGYKGENCYLFFDLLNNQISIYPIYDLENENKFINIIEKMNDSLDVKTFANELTSLWADYDEYDFNENYVDLKYTLRGIELKISTTSLKNGIFIYQNYVGDRSIQDLENVYIKDTDMVFDGELQRITKEQLTRIDQGDFSDEELAQRGTKFALRSQDTLQEGETGLKGLMFFSRDKEYPDSELERTLLISSWKWYDDFNFIYSVDNDGIYVYNCVTMRKDKIASIEDTIEINSVMNDKIIYNENNEIQIRVQ